MNQLRYRDVGGPSPQLVPQDRVAPGQTHRQVVASLPALPVEQTLLLVGGEEDAEDLSRRVVQQEILVQFDPTITAKSNLLADGVS